MRLFIAGLFLAGLSTSVSASVFQLNVAGNLEGAYGVGVNAVVGPDDYYHPSPLGQVDLSDPNSPFYTPSLFDFSGFGSAMIDTSSRNLLSNCSGMLSYMCSWNDFASFDENTGRLYTGNSGEGWSVVSLGPFASGSVGSLSIVDGHAASLWNSLPYVVEFSGDIYTGIYGTGTPEFLTNYTGWVSRGGFPGFRLDYNLTSYEISAVPLPASLPLLAFGFGALGLLGARRKKLPFLPKTVGDESFA